MNESMSDYYINEEDFLDEFSDVAIEAEKILNGDWDPNYNCNDSTRKNREHFLSTNQQFSLVYDGASVFLNKGKFSSVQIVLKSSSRIVTVRVRLENEQLIAEKIVDKKQ